MADLVVDNVKVLTDLGEEIHVRNFDTGNSVASKLNPFDQSKVKERFVRQVIRKHLLSQGMIVEGARVQISKAST
jgi:predicted signal transduction protein with EAL and GGDEF domain